MERDGRFDDATEGGDVAEVAAVAAPAPLVVDEPCGFPANKCSIHHKGCLDETVSRPVISVLDAHKIRNWGVACKSACACCGSSGLVVAGCGSYEEAEDVAAAERRTAVISASVPEDKVVVAAAATLERDRRRGGGWLPQTGQPTGGSISRSSAWDDVPAEAAGRPE